MKTIAEIREDVEKIYSEMNNFISEGNIPLMDIAYPNHDGIQDVESVAELMMLRDSLNSLSNACQIGIENINRTIE